MQIQVTQIQSFKYEMDIGESGDLLACFKETRTRLIDVSGNQLSESFHRDVISLDDLKSAIATL